MCSVAVYLLKPEKEHIFENFFSVTSTDCSFFGMQNDFFLMILF